MNTPTTFLYYAAETNEWQKTTLEELATLNDPDLYIIPIHEGGNYGQQTTWNEWQEQNKQPNLNHLPPKKEHSLLDYIFEPVVVAPAPPPTQPQPQDQTQQPDHTQQTKPSLYSILNTPINDLLQGKIKTEEPKPQPTKEQSEPESQQEEITPDQKYHYEIVEHTKYKGIAGQDYDINGLKEKINNLAKQGYRLVGVCSPTTMSNHTASIFGGGAAISLHGVVAIMEKDLHEPTPAESPNTPQPVLE